MTAAHACDACGAAAPAGVCPGPHSAGAVARWMSRSGRNITWPPGFERPLVMAGTRREPHLTRLQAMLVAELVGRRGPVRWEVLAEAIGDTTPEARDHVYGHVYRIGAKFGQGVIRLRDGIYTLDLSALAVPGEASGPAPPVRELAGVAP